MAAGYYDAGKVQQKATFELTIRRLPAHRNFVVAAGLAQAIDYLLNLSFTAEEIDYLRNLPAFARAPTGCPPPLTGPSPPAGPRAWRSPPPVARWWSSPPAAPTLPKPGCWPAARL